MKTPIYIFLFLYIFSYPVYGQNKINIKDTIQQIVVTEVGINRSREYLWQKFADSIDSYSKTRIFPAFLNDVCLDWRVKYWPGFHASTAVRWKVISLVKVRKSLELLLKDKPEMLKSKCSLKWDGDNSYPGDLTPPLNNISTYELINQRLKNYNNKATYKKATANRVFLQAGMKFSSKILVIN